MKEIVEIQVNGLKKMLAKKDIVLNISDSAISHLADVGFEPQFGARPIKRVIQREILNELSKEILGGKVVANSTININFTDSKLVFGN